MKKVPLIPFIRYNSVAYVEFNKGIGSDGGVMLLSQADRLTGLSKAVDKVLNDERPRGKIQHSSLSMLRQLIYGLALGHEALNDHDCLRGDLAWPEVRIIFRGDMENRIKE